MKIELWKRVGKLDTFVGEVELHVSGELPRAVIFGGKFYVATYHHLRFFESPGIDLDRLAESASSNDSNVATHVAATNRDETDRRP